MITVLLAALTRGADDPDRKAEVSTVGVEFTGLTEAEMSKAISIQDAPATDLPPDPRDLTRARVKEKGPSVTTMGIPETVGLTALELHKLETLIGGSPEPEATRGADR
jgi:hypothetical protein